MERISNHISDLLFHHDCVILPGFGGFVANPAPSAYHELKGSFFPPCKKISFNKLLSGNDGLLADRISRIESISFSEANSIISEEISNAFKTLSRGQRVYLEDVGALYFDREKNIQFEPAVSANNYLLSSYGLADLQPLIIERSSKPVIEPSFTDMPAVVPEKRKSFVRKYWPAAIAIPVVAAMFLLPFKGMVSNKGVSQFNLNPFTSTTEVPVAELLKGQKPHNTPVTAVVHDEKAAAPVSTSVAETPAVSTAEDRFFIIAGCFGLEENAAKLVESLKSQGFEASIIDKNSAGLYRVTYQGFANKGEALAALGEIKRTNGDAWLLNK